MKHLLTSLALKLVPEDGTLRDMAKRVYARLYPVKNYDIIHQEISEKEVFMLNDAVRIGFVGDLILLRDMVEASRTTEGFDFGSMFSAMKSYFGSCDLMTGVLEGPLPGEKLGYTTANYDDGRPLNCGYPDSFLSAIKKAGIGFVTVANNHLFDMGREGMERTVAHLESNAMPYVGFGDKSRTLIEVKGLKIAVLAYTYGFNGKTSRFFFEPGNEDLPHLIVPKKSKYYNQCLQTVKEDFEWAKQQNPHCILVYPHMGEQFLHSPEKNQLHWFGIFDSLGADMILGCHSHATQPVTFENGKVRLYCPGNFVNNYFPHDGDFSAMVEIYLDPGSGKPFAAAIVPIMAYAKKDGLLRAEPMKSLARRPDLSWHDWFRLEDAHKIVTTSMISTPLPLHQAQKRYVIWNDNTYRRLPYEDSLWDVNPSGMAAAKKVFEKASTIAFIGDSITEGTKNGGYGWFEPMMAGMPEKKVLRFASGSATSRTIIDLFGKEIQKSSADVYCIAIGCNDLQYREESVCAMTAEDYISNINRLVSLVRAGNPNAAIIFVSPWWSDDTCDKYCRMDCDVKHDLYQKYTDSLANYSKEIGRGYTINPNHVIWRKIRSECQHKYLVDWIHPNASDGIRLFSNAFIDALAELN